MRIHEVCQATGLTKKAINWYEEQGLIAIPTDENGYRDFQDADIQKLKEIGLLRSLGLSAKEIETVLRASDKPAALKTIQAQKQRALEAQQFQVELLGKLSQNYTPDAIEQLRQEWNLSLIHISPERNGINRIPAQLLDELRKNIQVMHLHHGDPL